MPETAPTTEADVTAPSPEIVDMLVRLKKAQRHFGEDESAPIVIPFWWVIRQLDELAKRRATVCDSEARALGWAVSRIYDAVDPECTVAFIRGTLEATQMKEDGTLPPDIAAELARAGF